MTFAKYLAFFDKARRGLWYGDDDDSEDDVMTRERITAKATIKTYCSHNASRQSAEMKIIVLRVRCLKCKFRCSKGNTCHLLHGTPSGVGR